MLAEDSSNGVYYDEGEQYYREEDLPDEQAQIEIIRRMRHSEVAHEAANTLQALAELKRQQELLQSSPSPQSTPEKN